MSVHGPKRAPPNWTRSCRMSAGARWALVRANAEVRRRTLVGLSSHCGVMRPFNLSISLLPASGPVTAGLPDLEGTGPMSGPRSPRLSVWIVILLADEPFCAADTHS